LIMVGGSTFITTSRAPWSAAIAAGEAAGCT
jgi:hypothetical protein